MTHLKGIIQLNISNNITSIQNQDFTLSGCKKFAPYVASSSLFEQQLDCLWYNFRIINISDKVRKYL